MDWTTRIGRTVGVRLQNEMLIWLTTVGSAATPFPSLVWFWWDGERVVVYSQPGRLKMENIAARPRVSLNFNSDPQGGSVGVLTGEARHDRDHLSADRHPGYRAKYEGWIRDQLATTPEEFAADYSEPVTIGILGARGW